MVAKRGTGFCEGGTASGSCKQLDTQFRLQPGQLPSPKEFRARFLNPKNPCEPRESEELRRLLSQVMIRNTRANAGIKLPPRRAETVLFEATPVESVFWQRWEAELRASTPSSVTAPLTTAGQRSVGDRRGPAYTGPKSIADILNG